jgi:GTPase SAR1 family protein
VERIVDQLRELLQQAGEGIRDARLPRELADRMEALISRLDEPCVLTVVGRAKAGKSTFVNALLGEDLAKVGVTETTATINFFRHGQPEDPNLPVRCYWRNGRWENVSRKFLDDLQGGDEATLRRAKEIERLEYLLPHDFLREVTLVDTPGLEAAVDEHQDVTADFLGLRDQLRQRHHQQTEEWCQKADAVIYLISQVPRATDAAVLEEFREVTGGSSRALNAVGVVAKVDLYPEIIDKVPKFAQQLKDNLNTIVPVSAGLCRALDRLLQNNAQALKEIQAVMRQIPQKRLQKLLDSDEFYEQEFPDCPVSVEERCRIRGDMPWSVFTTIVRELAVNGQALEDGISRLQTLAGFGPLREVLRDHFFKRARLLKAFRTVRDARAILDDIRYNRVPQLEAKDQEDARRRDRFLAFIRSAGGDPAIARELEELINTVLMPFRTQHVEKLYRELDRRFSEIFHRLEETNANFHALNLLEKHRQLFNEHECEELRRLLGLYGEQEIDSSWDSIDELAERQQFWTVEAQKARCEERRKIACRADECYRMLICKASHSKNSTFGGV